MRETVYLYAPERVQALEAAKNRSMALLAAAVLAGLLLLCAGLWLRMQWLCVLALIAAGWAAYYLADEPMRHARNDASFARLMQRGAVKTTACVWRSVTPEAVFVEGVRAHEVVTEEAGKIRRFYIRWGDEVPQIDPGTPVTLETVQRYIRTLSFPEGTAGIIA